MLAKENVLRPAALLYRSNGSHAEKIFERLWIFILHSDEM